MTSNARVDIGPFKAMAPEVYDALAALSQSAVTLGLEKDLLELVKVRASQMNGCTYCLQFHINLARQLGVPAAKLDQLAAWRESQVYSPRERIALHATEALTSIAGGEIPDEEFDDMEDEFGERGLAGLIAAVGVINVWNRIGITYRFNAPAAK
ncbi:MAG: alkylhydroperoxidase [Rhizobiales bacterium PAR1]|nr:MAG: alkylhydroperoxidase [Rhizobiales bacterium PAR1]